MSYATFVFDIVPVSYLAARFCTDAEAGQDHYRHGWSHRGYL